MMIKTSYGFNWLFIFEGYENEKNEEDDDTMKKE